MAKKPTRREIADAAWERTQQMELPQEAPQERTLPTFATVPDQCPKCDRTQTPKSGWTLMIGDILQCGGCGYSCQVPRQEFERLGAAIHAAHPHGEGYVKPKRVAAGPRVRGAG